MAVRVGFVGAGQMGEPMVERLLGAGLPVRLYVRRPEVGARLAALGATLVEDLAGLGSCDVVIACLFDDAQLLDVALGTVTGSAGDAGRTGGLLGAMRPGAVLVSHTTGTLGTLDLIERAATTRGIGLVEAPVSGAADAIRAGRLTILLAGAPDVVERAAGPLAAYGSPLLRTGPLGCAMKVKLVNNLLFAAHTQLAAEAIRLAGDIGVEPAALTGALAHCSGMSAAIGHLAASGTTIEEFGRLAGPFLRKDVAACDRAAAELGADIGLLGVTARSGSLLLGS